MSLWQEYAIEPSLFGDYSQARYLLDDFGMDSGRLIGGFPRKWQRLVATTCQNAPICNEKR